MAQFILVVTPEPAVPILIQFVTALTMKMMFKRNIIPIMIGILLVFQPISFAEEAKLMDIVVTNNRDDLLLYLNATGAFRKKTKKVILSGVPITFTYLIALNQARAYWFSRSLVDIKVSHTIRYDGLKKVFEVSRSWDSANPIATSSFEEAQKLMVEIDSLKITALKALEKGRHYQIRVKAELSKLTLPLQLHRVLFFLSFWDFETDWYTIDFTF